MDDDDTAVTVTVRLIKSFTHRNIKHVVFKDVPLTTTVKDFIDSILQDILTRPGLPPPLRKHNYDTLKISHKPFGAKTTDPVINKENDELILKEYDTLAQSGIVNETEISFFNMKEYRAYQQNPELTW